ncbi:hypothetical protein DMENIID0001_058540 [Sergentomyia squamirostris]
MEFFWLVGVILPFVLELHPTNGWCLKNLGVRNCDVELLDVAVYNIRAFLSVRRSAGGSQSGTLIETSWPETTFLLPGISRRFPNGLAHALGEVSAGKCQKIIQSFRTDVDAKGRLWMMDSGSRECPPKMIVYNLHSPWSNEVHRHIFENSLNFTSLTVDPLENIKGFTRAFLTMMDSNCLVVYSLEEKTFATLCSHPETIIPSFREIVVLNDGNILLYDQHMNQLQSADLRILRQVELSQGSQGSDENQVILFESRPLGELMGKASSLTTDSQNNLYYIIERDGVIVTCDIRKPLTAENHEVIHFDEFNMIKLLWSFKESLWVIHSSTLVAGATNHSLRIQ